MKTLAEKEKRAKKKFVAAIQKQCTSAKSVNKKTLCKKNLIVKKDRLQTVEATEVNPRLENDEENATCSGCDRSWKEDNELGVERTWVNCDICVKWLHTDCCSQEIDIESEEPFCCPECNDIIY